MCHSLHSIVLFAVFVHPQGKSNYFVYQMAFILIFSGCKKVQKKIRFTILVCKILNFYKKKRCVLRLKKQEICRWRCEMKKCDFCSFFSFLSKKCRVSFQDEVVITIWLIMFVIMCDALHGDSDFAIQRFYSMFAEIQAQLVFAKRISAALGALLIW